MNIQTRNYGENQVIISADDLQKLVKIAEQVEPIKIDEKETDFDTKDLMYLAEKSGAFDFLNEEGEDIYTVNDLKVKY